MWKNIYVFKEKAILNDNKSFGKLSIISETFQRCYLGDFATDAFFSELINDDHTFVSKDKIKAQFKLFKLDLNKNIVFSCGSGVTASVLALAYSLINDKYKPTIYDGSWSEYGKS